MMKKKTGKERFLERGAKKSPIKKIFSRLSKKES